MVRLRGSLLLFAVAWLGSMMYVLGAMEVTEEWDSRTTKEYCEVTSCAAASRRTRSGRLTQRALDSVDRHLRAMRGINSRTQVYAVTAVFPTRLPASGGMTLHACGVGFKNRNEVPGHGGFQNENRIFCNFRLNQVGEQW